MNITRVHRCGCRRVDGKVTTFCDKHSPGRGRSWSGWHDLANLTDDELDQRIENQRRSIHAKETALTQARIVLEELQREKGRRI